MALVASISRRCICHISKQNSFAPAFPPSRILRLHQQRNIESVTPVVIARSYSAAPTKSSKLVPTRRMSGPRVLKPPGARSVDFSIFREMGLSYFDKTGFIPTVCKKHEVALVCRPGRFGKTLMLNMLQYFHGFEHRARYKELFGDLAVDAAVEAGEVKPGCYVVIDFDFTILKVANNPEDISELLPRDLNETIRDFMMDHPLMKWDMAMFDFDTHKMAVPNFRQFLHKVADNIKSANTGKGTYEQLRGVEGIFITIHEYDASLLSTMPSDGDPSPTTNAFDEFFSTIKSSMLYPYGVRMVYMTGQLPVLPTQSFSSWNVVSNKTFSPETADLFGLTFSDISEALDSLYAQDEIKSDYLKELTYYAKGYRFTPESMTGLEPVFNTDTALGYLNSLQREASKCGFDISDPRSELSDMVQVAVKMSDDVVADMTQALTQDSKGNFYKLPYKELPIRFTAATLENPGTRSRDDWRSLIVHQGGLTFDPDSPTTHLKITNAVVATHFTTAICRHYGLDWKAVPTLVSEGDVRSILSMYKTILQQAATRAEHFEVDEATHRDRMCGILLQNHPHSEYRVQKRSRTGYIDICLDTASHRIIVALKCARLGHLSLQSSSVLQKAEELAKMPLEEVLALKFVPYDKDRPGKTIQEWMNGEIRDQLFDYGLSPEMNPDSDDRSFRAFAVVVIGERRVLFAEACLAEKGNWCNAGRIGKECQWDGRGD